MKVVLKIVKTVGHQAYAPGEIVDVPDSDAREMISRGFAVPAGKALPEKPASKAEEKPEAEVKPAPDKAGQEPDDAADSESGDLSQDEFKVPEFATAAEGKAFVENQIEPAILEALAQDAPFKTVREAAEKRLAELKVDNG